MLGDTQRVKNATEQFVRLTEIALKYGLDPFEDHDVGRFAFTQTFNDEDDWLTWFVTAPSASSTLAADVTAEMTLSLCGEDGARYGATLTYDPEADCWTLWSYAATYDGEDLESFLSPFESLTEKHDGISLTNGDAYGTADRMARYCMECFLPNPA